MSASSGIPFPSGVARPVRIRLKKLRPLIAVLVLAIAAIAAIRLWPRRALPTYIASGNGRIEANEYDVATKLPGRLAELVPQEGDTVQKGAVVGRIAAEDVDAQWDAAEAQAKAAANASREAQASLRAAESEEALARTTFTRSEALFRSGAITEMQLDRDRTMLESAQAALAAARARVAQARSAETAASSNAASIKSQLADATLVAPVTGRVLYRLVEPGVVLPAGGKVLTLVDLSDMYMTIFLPTDEAGKVAIGSEARIVLDALPGETIPAKVTFVAAKNQFTPREVETRDEREKLMFRVKVRIDDRWLASHAAIAKPGMPGTAYVRWDASKPWPDLHAAR